MTLQSSHVVTGAADELGVDATRIAASRLDATLSTGYWSLFAERLDVLVCGDGTEHPARATYAVDAATLSGTFSILDDKACGDEPRTLYAPITPTKTG